VLLEDVEKLDNKDFEPEQVDMAEGFKVMKKILQIPPSKLYQAHLDRLKNEALQDLSLKKRQKKLEEAKIAALLTNVHKVKQIAWLPIVTSQGNRVKHTDGTLKGRYAVMVEETDKNKQTSLTEVNVEADWAERQFCIVALAYAQKVAYEYAHKEVAKDKTGHRTVVSGYVDIEGENVTINVDNAEFHKVKYLPSRARVQPSNSEEGEDDENPQPKGEKWQAYSHVTGTTTELTDRQMREALPASFLEQVKRIGSRRDRPFVQIPPGAFRQHAEFPPTLEKGAKLQYFQKEDDQICMTTSFANCLYYCTCQDHAGQVFNQQKLGNKPDAQKLFKEYLLKLSPLLKVKNLKNLTVEMLKTTYFDNAVITCIKGSDGKEDHSISIYNGWIFDGTFSHALPLCRESLDHCCSSDDNKCEFVDFVNPFYFLYYASYVDDFGQGDLKIKAKEKRRRKKKA
ncbi:MAG TPA: hypothetical protein VIQ31_31800, partial [Phormidium sp.]